MSNGNTKALPRTPGWANTLRQYTVSIIVGFNVNPFSWDIGGDLGVNKKNGAHDLYFSWLPFTIIVGICKRREK